MAKSISLSTDMTKIYLIDSNGYSQEFSLAGNGVFITSIVGEVHVVAANSQLNNGTNEYAVNDASQWQAAYHPITEQALMIGDDDMDPGVAKLDVYDLSRGSVLNLRLNANQTKLLART